MKVRESGMPNEDMWQKFFDVNKIYTELEINANIETLVDMGFGYGTFTIPASRRINGIVYAYDIEEELNTKLKEKLAENNIKNVRSFTKDFISEGTDLKSESVDYVMLFNILHCEKSDKILKEAYRILKTNGKLGVIHWRYDSTTPRGPSMEVRPKPEELRELLMKNGFEILKYNINLPPYHYGILASKK